MRVQVPVAMCRAAYMATYTDANCWSTWYPLLPTQPNGLLRSVQLLSIAHAVLAGLSVRPSCFCAYSSLTAGSARMPAVFESMPVIV